MLPQFDGNERGWNVLGLCELCNGKGCENGLMNVKFRKLLYTQVTSYKEIVQHLRVQFP